MIENVFDRHGGNILFRLLGSLRVGAARGGNAIAPGTTGHVFLEDASKAGSKESNKCRCCFSLDSKFRGKNKTEIPIIGDRNRLQEENGSLGKLYVLYNQSESLPS